MDALYPVEYIKKYNFSGKLLIDGDLEDNCILFRFLFDKIEMVHPLLISVKALPIATLENYSEEYCKQDEKTFIFECNISDFNNPIMKTGLLFPEFLLKEYKIQVVNIESQVSYCLYTKENSMP